jgi:hypothetical protein
MSDGVVELRFEIEEPELWDLSNPNLYLAHVVLSDNTGNDIDDRFESFGVRTVKMVGSSLYLNGKKIVPRGTHDLANYFNDSLICPSDRSIVMDILLHKKMGATCSRWPSDIRMHYPRIAEYADQLGFMISWTGYFEMWTVHPEMEFYAKRDARAMVRNLRNHPSIIVWEMGDEPLMEMHDRRRLVWYETIYRLVEAEDRSRPIIPAGMWSNEMVDLVVKHKEKNLTMKERRRRVLEEYPVFSLELALWDIHHCPYLPPNRPKPTYEVLRGMRDALGGERPTIFTEFGIDGMPRFENVRSIYGKFRWAVPGIMPIDREAKDINYYGRSVGQDDWKETQAAQALLLSCIIGQLREMPDHFAGFYFPTLVDAWTFYWGVVDAAFNAKLSWFVVRNCYGNMYVTGLHGSVEHRGDEMIEIVASNFGDAVPDASLDVTIRNGVNRVVAGERYSDLVLEGSARVSVIGKFDVSGVSPGLYSIEYYISGPDGKELARRVELFYLVG